MVNKPYNREKYQRDMNLVEAAGRLNAGFGAADVSLRKQLLRQFGYERLAVPGGYASIDAVVKPGHIVHAFDNTVASAKKRVALYRDYVSSLDTPASLTLQNLERAIAADNGRAEELCERFAIQSEQLSSDDPLVHRYSALVARVRKTNSA